MRDFLLGVLVISVIAAIGLGGFGIYSYFTLDDRVEKLSDRVDSQFVAIDNQIGELSEQLNGKLEELSQQVEELQERQVLFPYRISIPPQVELSNIEELETSISFKVWDDFSIPAITVYPYEFPAQATVVITDPYVEGGIEVRAITVIDSIGNILLNSEPIPVVGDTIIEIEPTP